MHILSIILNALSKFPFISSNLGLSSKKKNYNITDKIKG